MSTSTALSTSRSRRRRRSPSPSSSSSSSSAPPPLQRQLTPPLVVPAGVRFMNSDAKARWEVIQHRSLAVEPALSPATMAEDDVMDILRSSVNEVLGTPDEGLTTFDFDLAEVADELSGGEFADWPHDTRLHTLAFSFKYATLHRALRARVLPTIDIMSVNPRVGCILFAIGTGVPVNFGHLMFHTIYHLACSPDVLLPVIFPCLISRVLSNDATVITMADDLAPPAAALYIPRLPLTVRTCLKAELVALRAQVASLHQREAALHHQLQTQPLHP